MNCQSVQVLFDEEIHNSFDRNVQKKLNKRISLIDIISELEQWRNERKKKKNRRSDKIKMNESIVNGNDKMRKKGRCSGDS